MKSQGLTAMATAAQVRADLAAVAQILARTDIARVLGDLQVELEEVRRMPPGERQDEGRLQDAIVFVRRLAAPKAAAAAYVQAYLNLGLGRAVAR